VLVPSSQPLWCEVGNKIQRTASNLCAKLLLIKGWTPCKMDYVACCKELQNLILKPGKGKGLGLVIVTATCGTHFILEYRTDWLVPLHFHGPD